MMFFRGLIIILLFFLIYRVLKGFVNPGALQDRRSPGKEKQGRGDAPERGALAQDPECGLYFPPDEGVSAEIDGQVVYFCSSACREKYLARKPV